MACRLPGHSLFLHSFVSTECPSQKELRGFSLIHIRVRTISPVPHSLEHWLQEHQLLQTPSTEKTGTGVWSKGCEYQDVYSLLSIHCNQNESSMYHMYGYEDSRLWDRRHSDSRRLGFPSWDSDQKPLCQHVSGNKLGYTFIDWIDNCLRSYKKVHGSNPMTRSQASLCD